jgi:hypothetical protein
VRSCCVLVCLEGCITLSQCDFIFLHPSHDLEVAGELFFFFLRHDWARQPLVAPMSS